MARPHYIAKLMLKAECFTSTVLGRLRKFIPVLNSYNQLHGQNHEEMIETVPDASTKILMNSENRVLCQRRKFDSDSLLGPP